MSERAPTRVIVADDSPMMRQIVTSSLTRAGVRVVGSAANGDEALALCERERPDALMLDLAMPGLDGLGVLRALQGQGQPTMPVVVVSAFSPSAGARAVDALAAGAFDLVAKPGIGEDLATFEARLIEKVRAATGSDDIGGSAPRQIPVNGSAPAGAVGSAMPSPSQASQVAPAPVTVQPPRRRADRAIRAGSKTTRAVVIATSTGGPRALAELLPDLPSPLGIGTLIIQHMPPGFTASLATRLDSTSKLHVREAKGGEMPDPSVALLAPGGKHLRIQASGRTTLTDDAEVGGLRPRADLTIEDAADAFGPRMLLVVLTGMGSDGLKGARAVRDRGGSILVQSRESCTVYGMPRAIEEARLADEALPLEALADAIAKGASA